MASKYWIKLYHEILDDDKIGMLRTALKWRFMECLLVAGERDAEGALPEVARMAWRLRCDAEKLETDLTELGDAGLLNLVDGIWQVTKFSERQAPSAAALKQRRYRKRKKEAKKEKEEEKEQIKDTYSDTYRYRNALRNESNAEKPPPKVPPLPAHLAVPELLNEWGEWLEYHRQRGQPMTWNTATRQFKQFEEMGIERSVAAIDFSITNKYTGLIEPKGNSSQRRSKVEASIDAVNEYISQ
jgi:hypothetical protein